MKQVYLVEYEIDDDHSDPVSAFSSQEKAELFLTKMEEAFPDNVYFISALNLDDDTLPELQ